METSSAATDSSRMIRRGSAASARAIAIRWRWPPDSALRQRAHRALVEADELAQCGDARPPRLRRSATRAVQAQHLVERVLGAVTRVEARVRVLEDDLDLGPAAPALGRRARRRRAVAPAGDDRAGGRPGQPDEHPRDRRLARARLADDRQRAAGRHAEIDVVDGDRRRRTPCAGPRA